MNRAARGKVSWGGSYWVTSTAASGLTLRPGVSASFDGARSAKIHSPPWERGPLARIHTGTAGETPALPRLAPLPLFLQRFPSRQALGNLRLPTCGLRSIERDRSLEVLVSGNIFRKL